jgi:SAM-dependent methyltransferase
MHRAVLPTHTVPSTTVSSARRQAWHVPDPIGPVVLDPDSEDQEMITDMTAAGAPMDEARVEAFAGRLLATYTEAMVALMIDVAARTGLFETLATGAGTSDELAGRAGLVERYVRECLGALVTAGIVQHDPATGRYALPPEHAVCLSGQGSLNLAPFSQVSTLLAGHVAGVSRAFRNGGGVPYEAFRPEFTKVMDAMSRGLLDEQLIDGILPLTGTLPERLDRGIRVADVGCGTGHAVNLLATTYPRSAFIGFDLSEEAIAAARSEAADHGLTNASFQVLDVAQLPAEPPFGAVFAFDAIHDQVDPGGVLARVHAALEPGGVFVMLDIRASSRLEDNVGNPLAPWLYGVSTLHCLTVSLAHDGAGLGTVWGEQVATRMLTEAGFVDVAVEAVPDDPFDSLYVSHKPH